MTGGTDLTLKAAQGVDGRRLWHRLMELGEYGATATGGVSRLALSAEEIGARRQLITWAREHGLAVSTDPAGNLFATLPGKDPALPAVMTGSHIDSQPSGGKFDGAYGVLAGLEALAAISAADGRPRRSVTLAVWMNEEASRFAPGMMGSKAFSGEWALEAIRAVKDADGVSVAEALRKVQGAEPDVEQVPLGLPVTSFVEAHIEQAPVLDRAGVPIGVVTGIQGTSRYRLTVGGTAGHAGTVPQEERRDAMMAAARIVAALDRIASGTPGLMLTVGMLRLDPGAPSVIPGEAYFSVDLRHTDDTVLESADRHLRDAAAREAAPCSIEVDRIAHAPNLVFPEEMRDRIADGARALGLPALELPSAAGHDARHLHSVCPTGMIFIPCRGGISHAETESCDPEDVGAGARVLAYVLADLANRPPEAPSTPAAKEPRP